MMRLAVIGPTGVVENVISLEPGSVWQPPEGRSVVDAQNSGPGWKWNGTRFIDRDRYVARDGSGAIVYAAVLPVPGVAEEAISAESVELIAFENPPQLTEAQIIDTKFPQAGILKVTFEALFEIANRLQSLEGKPPITRARLRTWLIEKAT